jgi:hypothetical protein
MSEHLHIDTEELRATLAEFDIHQYIVGEVVAIADPSPLETEEATANTHRANTHTMLRVTEIDYTQATPTPNNRELRRSTYFNEDLRPGTRYLITRYFIEHKIGQGRNIKDCVSESVVFDNENPETDALHSAFIIS